MMLKEIKKRMRIETVKFCVNTPEELRFLAYFDDSIVKEKDRLDNILNKNYGG